MTKKRRCKRCGRNKLETEANFRKVRGRFIHSCRKCYNRYASDYKKKHRAETLLLGYKRRSRARGLQVTISAEWLEQNVLSKPCHYCGTTEGVSADRIDNTKGYEEANVVPSCVLCNRVRSDDFTVQEMKVIGRQIRFLRERNMECSDSISALLFP